MQFQFHSESAFLKWADYMYVLCLDSIITYGGNAVIYLKETSLNFTGFVHFSVEIIQIEVSL